MRRLAASAIERARARRKYLSDKAIEPFMGDHHGCDVAAPAPLAERSKGEAVGHLEGVRCQLGQQCGHGSRQHCTIAAGERDEPCRQGDSNDSRRQLMPLGEPSRYHQEDFVAPGAVLRTQTIDRRSQATRTRAVEVRDLHHPHALNLTWTHVRSTTRHQRAREQLREQTSKHRCSSRDTPRKRCRVYSQER